MLNVLLAIGKILISTVAVFVLMKLLNKRNDPSNGKIIEGEIIEENREEEQS